MEKPISRTARNSCRVLRPRKGGAWSVLMKLPNKCCDTYQRTPPSPPRPLSCLLGENPTLLRPCRHCRVVERGVGWSMNHPRTTVRQATKCNTPPFLHTHLPARLCSSSVYPTPNSVIWMKKLPGTPDSSDLRGPVSRWHAFIDLCVSHHLPIGGRITG